MTHRPDPVGKTRPQVSRAAPLALLTLLLAAGAPLSAHARQPQGATAAAPAGEQSEAALGARQARVLARVAVLDLRALDEPATRDFRIAALALREACAMSPRDAHLARRWLEAAFATGDAELINQASRAVITADPTDTVAQLRLITARLAQSQTAQERLERSVALVGAQGRQIDPSVRSRIALDAALLARELGDERQFVELLKQATALDSTNKDAALLALSYFSDRVQDPVARFDLLSNLLLSDPLDPGAHVQLRDHLATHGAWAGAARFHSVALRILERTGGLALPERVESLAVRWRTEGPGAVLRAVEQDLAVDRERQRRVFEASEQQITGVDVRRPEDVRLAPPLEELRLASALATSDVEGVRRSLSDMSSTAAEIGKLLRDPLRRPPHLSEAEALAQAMDGEVELLLWSLLSGELPAEVRERSLTEIADRLPADDPRAPAIRALVALAADRVDEASTQVSSDVPNVWYVIAQARLAEARSDGRKAAALWREVEQAELLTALGAYASWRASQAEPGYTAPHARALAERLRTVPAWVDTMVQTPFQFQRLSVEPVATSVGALDPAPFTVRVRNLAGVPLGLGPGRTIDSRLLLIPRADLARPALQQRVTAEVLDISTRLRLSPGDEVTVTYWTEDTLLSWVAGVASQTATRLRLRAMQGFISLADGTRAPGPGSLDVTSALLTRAALPESQLSPADLAQRVGAMSAQNAQALAIAARSMALAPAPPEGVPALAQAFADAYASQPPQVRRWLLAELPLAAESEPFSVFDNAVQAEEDPGVLLWAVLTRAASADSPLLTRAIEQTSSPGLAEIARLHKERLSENVPTLTRRGTLGAGAAPSGGAGAP